MCTNAGLCWVAVSLTNLATYSQLSLALAYIHTSSWGLTEWKGMKGAIARIHWRWCHLLYTQKKFHPIIHSIIPVYIPVHRLDTPLIKLDIIKIFKAHKYSSHTCLCTCYSSIQLVLKLLKACSQHLITITNLAVFCFNYSYSQLLHYNYY